MERVVTEGAGYDHHAAGFPFCWCEHVELSRWPAVFEVRVGFVDGGSGLDGHLVTELGWHVVN